MTTKEQDWTPEYSRWRHGGWYVSNISYPSGACGCVSNNYPDKKWRIACDDRRKELGAEGDYTFPSRDAAARAELALVTTISKVKEESFASNKKSTYTAKDLAARYGHTSDDSNTTLKTEVNPDASDGHDEMMDLNVCGVGDKAYFEWVTEYGDPIGDVFYEVDNIYQGDLPTILWLKNLAPGDKVYWADPDRNLSSGYYTIHAIYSDNGKIEFDDTILMLINEMGSEAEVYASELRAVAPELKPFSVSLHEDVGDKSQIIFECLAIDAENAYDQAEDAYPNGEMLVATELDASELDRVKADIAQKENDQSYGEAEELAGSKESWQLVDGGEVKSYGGKVLGVTAHHVVQSLGKTAVIHHKANLDRVPETDEVLSINYDGTGRGAVEPKVEALDKSLSR